MPKDKKTKDVRDEAGYWFAKLERAVEENDYEDAADATKNLTRLGWEVKRARQPEVSA